MSAHDFCRLLLAETRKELTTAQASKIVGTWSYTYRWSGYVDSGEWHGPNGYYWHGSCCCAWAARQKGIAAWLAAQEAKDEAAHRPEPAGNEHHMRFVRMYYDEEARRAAAA